jgi:hypothetical protein
MPGVPESRAAMKFWSEQWSGKAFMAIGAADECVQLAHDFDAEHWIRGCGGPLVIADGGHFLQEWGGEIAAKALDYFA